MIPTAIFSVLQSSASPIVLLEGTRRVPPCRMQDLTDLAHRLASALPQAVFRSGNAEGSDEAFAQGVARVPGTTLQLLLPTRGMGWARRPASASCIPLDSVPPIERENLVQACTEASPENRRLFDLYLRGQSGTPAYSKALYLVRDAFKVLGSPALGLAPATLGIFFINESRPAGGGTGHTIRLCQQRGIPVLTQHDWLT